MDLFTSFTGPLAKVQKNFVDHEQIGVLSLCWSNSYILRDTRSIKVLNKVYFKVLHVPVTEGLRYYKIKLLIINY